MKALTCEFFVSTKMWPLCFHCSVYKNEIGSSHNLRDLSISINQYLGGKSNRKLIDHNKLRAFPPNKNPIYFSKGTNIKDFHTKLPILYLRVTEK